MKYNYYKINPINSLHADIVFKDTSFEYMENVLYLLPREMYFVEENNNKGILKEIISHTEFTLQEDGNYKANHKDLHLYFHKEELANVNEQEITDLFIGDFAYDEEREYKYQSDVLKYYRNMYQISQRDDDLRAKTHLLLLQNNIDIKDED